MLILITFLKQIQLF